MKALSLRIIFLVEFFFLSVLPISGQNWPNWRGPLGTGAALSGNPPITWSSDKNIRWKTRLPGTGHSTPAIWGNNIFITSALAVKSSADAHEGVKTTKPVKFFVIAIDRKTGKIKWERLAVEVIPHGPRHLTGAWAAASPITDGKYVWAFFGSRGLYCYSIEGKLIWKKDFGDMDMEEMGEGNSPALYKNKLIVNWDHYGQDFIVALQATSGREIWRKKREERISWTTPLIVEDGGRTQVIIAAENWIQSYDINNGDIIWKAAGTKYGNINTPLASKGIVYVGSGLRKGMVSAIRLKGAKGNINGSSSFLWSYDKYIPYVPSPLLLGNSLYFLKGQRGYLTCLDIATGKARYSNKRLEGMKDVFASPSGVKDKIYVLSRKGLMVVLQAGPKFMVLARNNLDDKFDASPVIVGDEIFLRGHLYLYCISGK